MPRTNPDDLLALRDIAALLGVSYDTIRRWHSLGKLPEPAVKISAKYQRWERQQIEQIGRRSGK